MDKHYALWVNLQKQLFDMQTNEKPIDYDGIFRLMQALEDQFDVQDAVCDGIKLTEKGWELALKLLVFGRENENNCFCYIGYIGLNSDTYVIGIYTEPCGIISFEGDDVEQLLNDIYALYRSQPADMKCSDACHQLYFSQLEYGVFHFEKHRPVLANIWTREIQYD